jgi:hypothetical protein
MLVHKSDTWGSLVYLWDREEQQHSIVHTMTLTPKTHCIWSYFHLRNILPTILPARFLANPVPMNALLAIFDA